jgi:magnesium-transporting ATPase (P-type)
MALALPQFWFAMVCGYSGQLMYFDFLFTLYNAVFTSLPILVLAMTDEHASTRALLKYPSLYKNGIENRSFGWGNFIGWIAEGIWQSMIVYSFAFWTPQISEAGPDGRSNGLWIRYLDYSMTLESSFIYTHA